MKFLRFAQWKIEQAGRGIVGMITNHSYLDNPTFRGMRQSLMRTFDDIYVLDLHGNSLKKEACPDGSPDKNVFDIRQGVAIAFLVKRGTNTTQSPKVHHGERWGLREEKYEWLEAHDIANTDWQAISPGPRSFLFKPSDQALQKAYERFPSVVRVFSENGTPAPGIVTTHDEFAISWTKEEARRKVQMLLQTRTEGEARMIWKLCSQSQWNYERAKKELADGEWRDQVVPILYRPFDIRWTIFNPNVAVHRRERVMRHMLAGENVAISTTRSVEISSGFQHAFCTPNLIQHHSVSLKEVNYLFPLYLYPSADRGDLFAHHKPSERCPNLNPKVVVALAATYGREPTSEEIFHYVYAVLYAPSYRQKYPDFLRLDFPRIPFTSNREVFQALAGLGARLAAFHLLKSPDLDPPAARFEGQGDGRVAKSKGQGLRYDPEAQRVYINQSQYFAPVPVEVWEYQIGGYQVCEKWLKDRRERRLELDDIRTYCRIVTALKHTIEIQEEIDGLYPAAESETISLPVSMNGVGP